VKLDRATVCLPTGDRQTAHDFYAALGFEAVGEEVADDGLPEPLQFEISAGLRVMLIPTGGFGWVIADRERSPRGTHECLVVIGQATDAAVDELLRCARDAGADIVMEAADQRWGYAGAFTDPDGHMWQVIRADSVLAQ
jgi:predicted lactoylglutathione lyase